MYHNSTLLFLVVNGRVMYDDTVEIMFSQLTAVNWALRNATTLPFLKSLTRNI